MFDTSHRGQPAWGPDQYQWYTGAPAASQQAAMVATATAACRIRRVASLRCWFMCLSFFSSFDKRESATPRLIHAVPTAAPGVVH